MTDITWGDWIEWHGGECPVEDGLPCQIRLFDGSECNTKNSAAWNWRRGVALCIGDISHYRLPVDITAITRRDQFAMAALSGMGTWSPLNLFDLDTDEARKTRAMFAVQQADALIAELAK